MERSARWVVVGVGAAVVLSIIAAVVASTRGTAELDASSPEGVVQAYLRAIADEDTDAAFGYLDEELASRCDKQELRNVRPVGDDGSFRAELIEADTGDREATVEVRITEFTGEPPFGGPGYDHDERYELARADGSWRITSFSWPYYPCPQMP